MSVFGASAVLLTDLVMICWSMRDFGHFFFRTDITFRDSLTGSLSTLLTKSNHVKHLSILVRIVCKRAFYLVYKINVGLFVFVRKLSLFRRM